MCWAMLHNTMCSTFNASQMFDFLACVESNVEHQINFLKEWQMPLQATASKKLKRGWIDKRSQEIKKLKSTIQLKSIEPHRQKLACPWPSGFFINMVDEPMAKWELFCQKAHTEKKKCSCDLQGSSDRMGGSRNRKRDALLCGLFTCALKNSRSDRTQQDPD